MNVTVDVSGTRRLLEDARRHLHSLPMRVQAEARRAAETERSSHRYQNRTHRLQDGTRAVRFGDWSGFTVDLFMGAFYGAFMIRRGFSEFDTYAKTAASRINAIMKSGIRG